MCNPKIYYEVAESSALYLDRDVVRDPLAFPVT